MNKALVLYLSILIGCFVFFKAKPSGSDTTKPGTSPRVEVVTTVKPLSFSSQSARKGAFGIAGYTPTVLGDEVDGFAMISGKGLKFRTIENVPGGSSEPLVSEDRFSASYEIDGFHGIGTHEIYVWGVTTKGFPIIERWSFAPSNDGYWMVGRQEHQGSPKGEGVPMEPNAEKLLNGVFKPSSQRWKSMLDSRSLVYESPIVGRFSFVSPDAEGRYLMFMLNGDDALYQLWISDGSISTVASSGVYPVMNRNTLACSTWNDDVWGRCFLVSFVPVLFTNQEICNLLACDIDNDGIFDSIELTSPDIEEAHDAFIGRAPSDRR